MCCHLAASALLAATCYNSSSYKQTRCSTDLRESQRDVSSKDQAIPVKNLLKLWFVTPAALESGSMKCVLQDRCIYQERCHWHFGEDRNRCTAVVDSCNPDPYNQCTEWPPVLHVCSATCERPRLWHPSRCGSPDLTHPRHPSGSKADAATKTHQRLLSSVHSLLLQLLLSHSPP